jgi:hypothetical protein
MIIEQTVEITANHRLDLHLDVPQEIPIGKTRMIIQFPMQKPVEKNIGARGGDAKSATPHLDFLSGICAGAGDITLEQIRKERLSKYLK